MVVVGGFDLFMSVKLVRMELSDSFWFSSQTLKLQLLVCSSWSFWRADWFLVGSLSRNQRFPVVGGRVLENLEFSAKFSEIFRIILILTLSLFLLKIFKLVGAVDEKSRSELLIGFQEKPQGDFFRHGEDGCYRRPQCWGREPQVNLTHPSTSP